VISLSNPAESGIQGQVQILVFEQKDCPYCEELRDRLAPAITREFGSKVGWSFRSASEMPGIRNTPTVVVIPLHGKGSSVFEGLPTHEVLAAAVREQLMNGVEKIR
jgi:protein-disulfide isomerase